MPKAMHTKEQIQTGTIISYVITAFFASLSAIIVVGIKLKQAQPTIQSIIISLVAYPFLCPLSIFDIAFIAIGVTAFETPKMLALIQAVISSVAYPFLNERGKIKTSTGFNILDSSLIIPLSFNTSIIPFQNAIIPTREMHKVTLFSHPSSTLLLTSAILPLSKANTKEVIHKTEKHLPRIVSPP